MSDVATEIIRLPMIREAAVVTPEALAGMCGDDAARHCQVTVARNDASSSPEISTPDADGGPWRVRVPLVKEGGGCEYIVRVGLERTSGQPVAGIIGSEVVVAVSGGYAALSRPFIPVTVAAMDGTPYLPNYDYYYDPERGLKVPNRSRIDNGERLQVTYQGGGEPPSTSAGRPTMLKLWRTWDGQRNRISTYELPLAEVAANVGQETIIAVAGGWVPLLRTYAAINSVSGKDNTEYRKNDDYYTDPVRGIRVPLSSRIKDGDSLLVKYCIEQDAPAERPDCDKFEAGPLPGADLSSRLFPNGCYDLLQVRYLDAAGYPVSLFIYSSVSYDADEPIFWEHVMVIRHSCSVPAFRRRWEKRDNLRVCAALSEDLTTLYITYSVGSIGLQQVSYLTYVWDMGLGTWGADPDRSGVVNYASYDRHRGTTVDRRGRIGSFYKVAAYNADATDSDGSCLTGGYYYSMVKYDHGYRGESLALYDINTRSFVANPYITGGITIANGDMATIVGDNVKLNCQYSNSITYWYWFAEYPYRGTTRTEIGWTDASFGPGGDAVSWGIDADAIIPLGQEYTESLGEKGHGFRLHDYVNDEGVEETYWRRDLYYAFMHVGSNTLSLGRGPVVMDGSYVSHEYPVGNIFEVTSPGSVTKQCPNFSAPSHTGEKTISSHALIHPEYAAFGADEAWSVLSWFWAVDSASGDEYFGIRYQDTGDRRAWKIYRNGEDITVDSLGCDNQTSALQAIYLRD